MRRIFWNKPYKLRLVFGTTLLAIIPIIIIGYLSYYISYQSLHNEIGKAKIETLLQVQSRIDDKLKTINKTIVQHIYTSSIEQFVAIDHPMDNVTLYKETIGTLSSIEALVDYVESATLYIPSKEILLSSNRGIYSSSEMDYKLFSRIKRNSDTYFWIDDLNQSKTMRDGSKNVTYVRMVPYNTTNPTAYLIIRVKDQAFFDIYNELTLSQNNDILIATPSGTIFSDWYRDLLKDDNFNYDFITDIGASDLSERYYTSVVDGQKMLISYSKSDYNNWTYISVIPVSELSSSFSFIKNFTTILCTILALLCIGSALLLSRHFYNGIGSLLERIKGKATPMKISQARQNEIEYINDYMENLQDLNLTLYNQINKDKALLRASFVHSLLHEALTIEDISSSFSQFELPQHSSFYSVLSLEIKFVNDTLDKDKQLLIYAAAALSEEALMDEQCIVSRSSYQNITIIINHDELYENTEQLRMQKAFSIGERLSIMISKHLKLPVTVGIGRCYDIVEIRRSYKESREALQSKLILGTGKVIYIDQVDPVSKHHSFSYPYDLEQQILLFLKLGQLQQVEFLLQQFTSLLRKDSKMNVELIKISYTQLAYRVQKELYNLDPELAVFKVGMNIVEKINQLSTMDEIEDWIKNHFLITISKLFQKKRSENQLESMNRVMTYIEEHYQDDLSQSILAEIAGLPYSQFGQAFKEKIGVNLSEYIINFRMEKARALLVETNMLVSEIADHLCYNNSQNFIRTFKRVNGVTPGDYRNSNKLKDAQ